MIAHGKVVSDPTYAPTLARVVLRQPIAADLSRLGEWNAGLIRDEGHDNPMSVAELTERMREWLAGEYRARIFVCDDIDAGYALYRDLPEFVHLRQFYVAPEWRRRGIGAAALRVLREREFPASKRVLVEAMSWNAAALAFWRACGFGDRYVGLEAPPLPKADRGRVR
jgi:GNAT superfamily N-acetyltransferase